jgi:hypothetical protein
VDAQKVLREKINGGGFEESAEACGLLAEESA